MKLLRFTLPKGTDPPLVGDTVCLPVRDGADWLELGTFVEARLLDSGDTEFALRLHPDLGDTRLEGTDG